MSSGPDFQTFVMVFPDDGRVMLQKARHQFKAGLGQQFLRPLRRLLARLVVSRLRFALALLPMRHRVDRRVFRRPPSAPASAIPPANPPAPPAFPSNAGRATRVSITSREKSGRAGARQQAASAKPAGAATMPLEPDLAAMPLFGRQPVGARPADGKSASTRPLSWASVCAIQRASVRSSKSSNTSLYSFQSRSGGSAIRRTR